MTLSDERPVSPVRLELQHPVFSTFGEVRFRRAKTDDAPVLTMRLGEREAQLPLAALQRELGIADESADGRMLALIAAALDYVPSLQPGDRLPSEVLTGQASWRPSAKHLVLATTRLRLNLVAWFSPRSRWTAAQRDDPTLLRLAANPALAREVQAASVAATRLLGVGDGAQFARLMAALGEEMSYIEALRERLLCRVDALCRRVTDLRVGRRLGATAETLSQVHRLSLLAAQQIRTRFDDVDAATRVFDALGRNGDGVCRFIRTTRDGLYCSQRAWEPVLARWERTTELEGPLLVSTYRFLASRCMPITEWQAARRAPPDRVTGASTLLTVQIA